MEYTINKSLSKKGSNYIFKIEDLFILKDGAVFLFNDSISGLTNDDTISREFSFSYKTEWSNWIGLTDEAIKNTIDLSRTFKFRVRYTVLEKTSLDPIIINSFSIQTVLEIVETCNLEYNLDMFNNKQISTTIEQIGESFSGFHRDMNRWINENFGIEVLYLRTEPDMESEDVILNEYSINNVVEQKCIKVVLPDNKIPEPIHDYSEWGIDFTELEIHISKDYFESMFGSDTKPRKKDIIYFKLANRLYTVFSTYLARGINEISMYHVIKLKKYEDDASVLKDDDIQKMLDDVIIQHEDKFEEVLAEERDDALNLQQYSAKTIADDEVRQRISSNMLIVSEIVKNNGTQLLNGYYDMVNIPFDEVAIKYKKSVALDDSNSFGLLTWIKLREYEDFTGFSIVNQIQGDGIVTIMPDKNLKILRLLADNFIIDSNGDIHKIVEVGDSSIDIESDELLNQSLTYKKAQIDNIFSVSNFSVYLVNNSIVYIETNHIYKSTAINLNKFTWYGLCVNISSEFNYIGIYVWEIVNRTYEYDTNLNNKFRQEISTIEPIRFNEQPCIMGSNLYISNIRYIKRIVEHENQSLALSSHIVNKPSLYYVIDNANEILNIGNIGSGITKTTRP